MKGQQLSREETARAVCEYAAELLHLGEPDWRIKNKLQQIGVDEQSASAVIEGLRALQVCAKCGQRTRLHRFTLPRVLHAGKIMVVRRGSVLLCDDCHKFFSRANTYRHLGIATVVLGSFLAMAWAAGPSSLWLLGIVVALLTAGTYLVIKGRRQIAALEEAVGFG